MTASVHELVRETFARNAVRTFLIDARSGRRLTYADFEVLARRFAGTLHGSGLVEGDRVGLLLEESVELAALYFACLLGGLVAVPINPILHPRELAHAATTAHLALLVTSDETQALLDDAVPVPRRSLGSLVEGDGATSPAAARARDDEPYLITFTSGSTGLPKKVVHKASSVLACARAFNTLVGVGPEHRFLHVMPMTYMAGILNTLFCPFMAEGSVVLAGAFSAQTALRFWGPVIDHEANTFWLAPTMLAALLQIDRDSRGREHCRTHVRTICVGTAPLPLHVKNGFEERYGVPVLESYGLSELLFVTSNSTRYPRKDRSVGRAVEGAVVRVGARGEGESDGEIEVATRFRQIQDPKDGPSSTTSEWFPTGDLGYVDPEGNLFVTGRRKDLIIRGGVNVSPRAVEELLEQHPLVRRAAVVGLPHDFYGEEVVAAVVLGDETSLEAAKPVLEAFCRERLSQPSWPTKFFAVDSMPTSSTGKLQKAKLKELLAAGSTK